MTLLLLVPAWLLALVFVAGLCKAARSGDADQRHEQALRLRPLRVQDYPSFPAADFQRASLAVNHSAEPARERDGVGVAA